MNGWELERLLDMIDENMEANGVRLRAEILRFMKNHEDTVVDQFRRSESVRIPTSFGDFVLHLADLRKNVFNPIAA
jgi:hypothetical protein